MADIKNASTAEKLAIDIIYHIESCQIDEIIALKAVEMVKRDLLIKRSNNCVD